jgi:hypothetical protein
MLEAAFNDNRARLGIPKTHALDAACVGEIGMIGRQIPSTEISGSESGNYCRTQLTAHGFRRGYCMPSKSVRVGDMGRTGVPAGNKAAIQTERVAVQASGSLRFDDANGIYAKYCQLLHRADRYGYGWQPALPAPAEARGLQRGRLG